MKSLNEIGRELDVPAYVVDPVVVDEMKSIARITGLPEEFFLIIISYLDSKNRFFLVGTEGALRKKSV